MRKQQDLFKQELPYEKFMRFGPESLTDGELLAIILRTGTREKSALTLANEVLGLARFPRTGLLGLYDLSLQEIMKVKGIGEVKAVKLKSLTELSMRFSRAQAQKGMNFRQPGAVAEYYMERLRHRRTECVCLACLDAKGQLISEAKLSDGAVNKALISPREVFLKALEAAAVNVILVHNHPSGDPTPSAVDREITQKVKRMGWELGIPLLDHVIIGDNTYFSFRNEEETGSTSGIKRKE